MLDILKALAHGVGDMTYGDPDDVDAVKAADVVRWAAAEIARLRDERPEVVPPVMWKLTNYLQVMTWQPFFDDVVSRRDGEWIRAIAASGGKVKEVPRD
jgi:hypothetical protein